MDPSTILTAINAAKVAIDAAIKVKDNFFGPDSTGKANSKEESKPSITLEELQAELATQKKKLDQVVTEANENRTIVQEQNEIIIGLSNALKVTAETVQQQRLILRTLAAFSAASILVSLYALFR